VWITSCACGYERKLNRFKKNLAQEGGCCGVLIADHGPERTFGYERRSNPYVADGNAIHMIAA
jgi:hypothetical protein